LYREIRAIDLAIYPAKEMGVHGVALFRF